MTAIGDLIFIVVWLGALIFAIRLMSNGWSLMSKPERKEEMAKHQIVKNNEILPISKNTRLEQK